MPPETLRPAVIERATCRVCHGSDLEPILSLGETPLANAFLRSPDEFADERRFPLELYWCRQCTLLQLIHVVDPEVMFRHYLYVTGTSTTIAAHNQRYADTLVTLLRWQPGDLAVEIASNDGSLLGCFRDRGIDVLGIEPARNLATRARAAGIDTVNEFFTPAVAEEIRAARGPARAVMANNVLAHVDEPVDFLRGCRTLLSDDGLVTIEVPHLAELIDRLEYDTVYHEHLSYFSLTSLLHLCERADLAAVRVDRVAVHGGSLRLYLSRSAPEHGASVRALAAEERRAGLADLARYQQFAAAVRQSRDELVGMLGRLVGAGKRLAGYGAPAKGNTLLNYCGIDTRLLPYTVDRNPLKVGLFTPGMHIPVRDVAALEDGLDDPDYVLILAWNFAEEIMRQQHAYSRRGGRFIVPVPAPQMV
jgi:hypothetical protein